MTSHQADKGIALNAKEFSGQNERNKDEFLNQVSDALMQEAVDNLARGQTDQTPSYPSQAANFLQQTGEQMKNVAQGAGEQVKNIAQGATEAVKSTLGMSNKTAGNPSNRANSAGTTTSTATDQH